MELVPPVDPEKPVTELPPTGEGSPPPAAVIVQNAPISESSAAAAAELEKTQKALRDRESRIAALEDENKQLRTPPPDPAVKQKRSFLSGLTLIQ